MAPLMVARFFTSGTVMSSSLAARSRPLSLAAFRFGPVPVTDMGADSSNRSIPTIGPRPTLVPLCAKTGCQPRDGTPRPQTLKMLQVQAASRITARYLSMAECPPSCASNVTTLSFISGHFAYGMSPLIVKICFSMPVLPVTNEG